MGNKHIHDGGVMNGDQNYENDQSDQNDQTIEMLKTPESCVSSTTLPHIFFNEHANIFSVFCHVFLCRQYPQTRKRGH
jgi:hypothetical protein